MDRVIYQTLSQGLRRYGYKEKSDAMKLDIIQLPIRFGFHEYFDSQNGQGYGSSNFSWTSALFLDVVDPRIHFALVCGSRSCAPIRFYEEDHIDEQLETAASNFINSSEVIILPEENRMFLSQIFNWYRKDFGGKKKVLYFLLKYLHKDEKSEFLKRNIDTINVDYLFYDWNLNH